MTYISIAIGMNTLDSVDQILFQEANNSIIWLHTNLIAENIQNPHILIL